MSKKKQSTRRKEVRKSLEDQLKAQGKNIALFYDKIEDYMDLWDLKEKYKEDIRTVGLRTEDGKESGSPRMLLQVERQMDILLKAITVTAETIVADGDDDAL